MDGTLLAGGTFNLYKVGKDTPVQSGLVTDANGQIVISGLTEGEYYFEETEAPDGYKIPNSNTTDRVNVESGLKQTKTYDLFMENDPLTVRYAVKIWGICRDTYSYNDGATTDTASLTFGPALGDNESGDKTGYLNTYVECGSDTCIHKLSWDEIIELCEQNQGDEVALNELFGSCKENGCTKTVELKTNSSMFNLTNVNNYLAQGYEGDGVSCLYYLIDTNENSHWNYSYGLHTSSDPSNIYSRSRIRTTLNGDDTNIEKQLAAGGTNYYYSTSYPLLDEDTCLFSCFPANLQSAIVPREVKASNSSYDETTYDNLWLFARTEAGSSYSSDNGVNYGIVGSSAGRIAYEFSSAEASSPAACSWWSRSRYSSDTYFAYYVYTTGGFYNNNVHCSYGLSPGFCIK